MADDARQRRRDRWRWWLAALVLPALFVVTLSLLDRGPRPDPTLRLGNGWINTAPVRAPPPFPGPGWQPIALPHRERVDGGDQVSVWFQLQLPASVARNTQPALLIPEPYGNFAVYVNGTFVGDGGRMEDPLDYQHAPMLFDLPPATLTGSNDTLTLRFVRDGRVVSLGSVYAGPHAVLAPVARYQRWINVEFKRIIVLFAMSLALLALGFYALRPADTAYGWFAAALLFWSWHVAQDQFIRIPVPRAVWIAWGTSLLGLFVACAILFTHRFLNLRLPRVERAILALAVLMPLTMLTAALTTGWGFITLSFGLWVPTIILGGLYLVLRLAFAAWRAPGGEHLWLLAAAATTWMVGVRDHLFQIGVVPWGTTFHIGFALAVAVAAFGTIVVRRFARAVNEVERLNRDLERRIAAKSDELERNHAQLREMEREQTQRRERERIMREMHDGVGGQLVQGLAVLEYGGDPNEARTVLEECLTELRLMVDASDAAPGNLVELLARFRHRIERRLHAAGIKLDWQVVDLPPLPGFGSAEAVHVLRILQETFANALRHAAATRIRVATGVESGAIWIEVGDNGCGMAGGSTGHGIDGMRQRAALLGGELNLVGDQGTAVRLTLPYTRD